MRRHDPHHKDTFLVALLYSYTAPVMSAVLSVLAQM